MNPRHAAAAKRTLPDRAELRRRGNAHLGKRCTIRKGFIADLCHTVRNDNGAQIAAAVKCPSANGFNIVGDGIFLKLTKGKRILTDTFQRGRPIQFRQTAAIVKRIVFYADHPVRQFKRRKAFTHIKSFLRDLRNSRWNVNTD